MQAYKKYITLLIHITGWLVFFLFPLLPNFPQESILKMRGFQIGGNSLHFIFSFLLTNLFLVIFFYCNLYWLLPKIYARGKKVLYFIIIVIPLVMTVYVLPYFKNQLYPPERFIYAFNPKNDSNIVKNEVRGEPALVSGRSIRVEEPSLAIAGNIIDDPGFAVGGTVRMDEPNLPVTRSFAIGEGGMPGREDKQFFTADEGGVAVTKVTSATMPLPPHQTLFNRRMMIDGKIGFLLFLMIWFLSSMIYLAQRNRYMERSNKEAQVQKLDAELSYLKAQIHPHFLFNTLNNIYSLSICQSEHTPEAILKLSSIMRYVTQDAEAETVPLEKELEYVENYIALQQLRSDNNVKIDFTVTGNINGQAIAPLLLINFIENAFKHGISSHLNCFVNIAINVQENNFSMTVLNKKMASSKTKTNSTGINNTKRRLELQYPGKYVLLIADDSGLYKVTLQLNLA